MKTTAAPDQLRTQWDRESYILLRGMASAEETAELLALCEHAREQWLINDASYGRQTGNDAAWHMRHVNHAAYFKDHRSSAMADDAA